MLPSYFIQGTILMTKVKEYIAMDLLANLKNAMRNTEKVYKDALYHLSVTPSQSILILLISTSEGVNISRLAQRCNLDRTTLSRNLKILKKNGMVELTVPANKDKICTLSSHGRFIATEILTILTSIHSKILSPENINSYMRLLSDLIYTPNLLINI